MRRDLTATAENMAAAFDGERLNAIIGDDPAEADAPIVTGLDRRRHPARRRPRPVPVAREPIEDERVPAIRERYGVGIPGHFRPATSPGWGLLCSALQAFCDNPAPLAELTQTERGLIRINIARIQEMMS